MGWNDNQSLLITNPMLSILSMHLKGTEYKPIHSYVTTEWSLVCRCRTKVHHKSAFCSTVHLFIVDGAALTSTRTFCYNAHSLITPTAIRSVRGKCNVRIHKRKSGIPFYPAATAVWCSEQRGPCNRVGVHTDRAESRERSTVRKRNYKVMENIDLFIF